LTLLKDKVYIIGKKKENNVNCFFLHYYLNGYYHITIEKCIDLKTIDVGSEICDASRNAYALSMTNVATLDLGSRPRQRAYKVAGQEEARESHRMLPGM
jgi:hypothetical protein